MVTTALVAQGALMLVHPSLSTGPWAVLTLHATDTDTVPTPHRRLVDAQLARLPVSVIKAGTALPGAPQVTNGGGGGGGGGTAQGGACCICLRDLCVGERATALPHCMHVFHTACVKRWLRRKNTCPLCCQAVG